MDPHKLRDIALFAVPLLLSLSFHEMCHAWAAHKLGDDTGRLMGRLTLNPLAHIDIIGTIVFPIICIMLGGVFFGWAKPVPVNPLNLKGDRRRSMLWVSLMGPLSNFLLAFTCTLLLGVCITTMTHEAGSAGLFLGMMLSRAIYLNLILCFFNLMPIPPLDGAAVLQGVLPHNLAEMIDRIAPYGVMILLLFLYTGFISIIAKPVYACLNWFLYAGSTFFDVNMIPYYQRFFYG
ncbi:MAG: site-2 protease family protein [Deltaproteobacteria bacterium]|nr:site-2 protease family protein [Deltaproteobacteria bacterium]